MKKVLLFVCIAVLMVAVLPAQSSGDPYADQLDRGLLAFAYSDTATTVVDSVSLAPEGRALILFNRSETVDLHYSYDGSIYFLLPPLDVINERISAPYVKLKTLSGTAQFDLKAAKRQ